MDKNLAYMFYDENKNLQEKSITKTELAKFGSTVETISRVEDWFEHIQNMVKTGYSKPYIISWFGKRNDRGLQWLKMSFKKIMETAFINDDN